MTTSDSLYPVPFNEEARLAAVATSPLVERFGDPRLRAIARLSARALNAQAAAVVLVWRDGKQILVSHGPLPVIDRRAGSPCAYTIMQDDPFVVPDLSVDPRFVVGGEARFYAGQALLDPNGLRLGTIFVLDTQPRPEGLSEADQTVLVDAARLIRAEAGRPNAAARGPDTRADDDEARLQLMATIAHEIRSPLSGIVTTLDLIAAESFGPVGVDAYRSYARDAASIARTVSDIVAKTLDLTRLVRGDVTLEEDTVVLHPLFGEVLHTLEGLAQEAGITPTLGPMARVHLLADRTFVFQMLSNVVQNALKYSPAGGEVILSATLEDHDTLDICVRDTGRGMTASEIEDAQRPFSTVGEKGHGSRGVGLGLSLVKRLVEVHGGRLLIASTPGMGTTVTLRFPPWRVREITSEIPAPLGTGDRVR